jgi:HK97 family phage prohead protease
MVDERIIKKESDGYHVYSEDGKKHLGGPYSSLEAAKKRLGQVDFFKKKGQKSLISTPEKRFLLPEDAELRVVVGEGGKRKIVGKAAVFGKLSQNLGGFLEKMHPDAFKKVLKTADVRGLRNHDPDKLLGRTKNGTMRLKTDKEGLHYEIDEGNTTHHRDTMESIDRGDLDGSSFSFTVDDDGDEWDDSTEPPTRTVHCVRDLFDVGPVTYPAYLDSSAGMRALGECRSLQRFLEFREQARVEQARQLKRLRLMKLRLGVSIF